MNRRDHDAMTGEPAAAPAPTMARALAAARARWRQWTEPYDSGHVEAAQFRSLQVQSAISLTPLVLLANWANVAVVGWSFRGWPHRTALVVWMCATAFTSAAGVRGWLTWRAGRWPGRNSPRTLVKAVQHAALLALLWALPMAVSYRDATVVQRPLLVGLSVGMICAGGFALAAIPRAAFAYVLILSAGLLAGFWSAGGAEHALMMGLATIYAGIVLATVVISSRQMGARLAAEADSARQKRLMDLLLDDFQENARDWLWEVSADGRIRYGSQRLAEAFGLPLGALEGAPLTYLLRDSLGQASAPEIEAINRLDRALADGNAFRDLQVPVSRAGQQRWWSLTGKRLFDEAGRASGWRGVGVDVTRTREQGAELTRLANFDTLTGLANRHQFQERLRAEAHRPFTLLYLDLDDFKAINDLHGHTVGDKVLRVVAERFRSAVRRDDLLARIGGDEFALVTWSTSVADATAAAERLIASLRAPMHIDELDVRVGTCAGIVLGERDMDSERLTRHADMALYAAKARGRNTYEFFECGMEDAARHRLNLLSDLHTAVGAGQLELYYQPLVRFGTARVVGAEALMRWNHPTRGLVRPGEFIPLAEESGLILPMGQWALREACAMAATWPAHMRVAVNVSARQFLAPGFVDDLRALLGHTGLAPNRLELEITESLLIDDSRAARAQLAALRVLGVRVALDDFGTGYSSLAYLRTLPLDALKIDGAFVRSLDGESQSLDVIRAIVQLARALRMNVTAEGIETQAQFDTLLALGCTDAQGFLLAHPTRAEDLSVAFSLAALPSRVVAFDQRGRAPARGDGTQG